MSAVNINGGENNFEPEFVSTKSVSNNLQVLGKHKYRGALSTTRTSK